ncbi:MAG: PD-(D/E)XK nuclease family protein [Anaerolineae bacterium]|nr:PD-(D/E)XK nuclease family protein [Anaerolineae bacterium]
MATHLLLAPTGHGKTEYALHRIRATRADDPLAPIWIILPNQIQIRAFGQRLGAAGGAFGVELGTFYRFYAELLARSGQPTARLPDSMLHRLLLRLVNRLADDGTLCYYASLRGCAGLARLLRTLFQELKQARVQREAFEAVLAGAPPRLAELGILYAAYQDWLIRSDWMDAEGQGWLAALALEHEPALAADLRLLVVDGFDEFNPTQLAVLALLAERAAEAVITLTGDPACEDRIAHRRFCRARQAVEHALHLVPDLLPFQLPTPGIHYPPALAHLEAALFQPATDRLPAGGTVLCLEAQNRATEARAALRWLKALLVREGYRLDQVALLARNLEPYRTYLDEVAAEFGLPLHLAGGQPLAGNPAVVALLNLLALPATNWPRRPLLDALACPYFDWSAARIGPEEVRALGAVARAGLVIAGLDQWRDALARQIGLPPGDADSADAEDMLSPGAVAGELAHDLPASLEAVVTRLTPPPSGTMRSYVAFVEDLIGEDPKLAPRFRSDLDAEDDSLRVVARAWEQPVTAERDVAALRRFKDVLRGLVLAEAILPQSDGPSTTIDYARFFVELRGATETTTYELPAPPPGSALLAAPLLHARGLAFRAVALLGLSEGEFPQPEREDPLLTESDRARLCAAGLPLAARLQGDEASLFYEATTRARERLLLTRPYLADDGQAWEPSPYWDEVLRLVDAPVVRMRAQDPLPLIDVASLPEALLTTAQRSAGWPSALPGWDRVLRAADVVRAREAADPTGSPWEGNLTAVASALAAHYNPDHVWSASRLEAYATCPYLFFASSVLGLEPRLPPTEGYDIRILGTMYHAVLEETYRRALPGADPDRLPGALRALLPGVATEVFDAAPDKYAFRPTALWTRQREELIRILVETLEALIDATAGWQPVALEQAFGIKGCPPLDVEHNGRHLRLRGFVDRLDRDADGRLQVIDYKAGSTPISPRDLDSGKRVQLPLYALAVREALGLGEVGGGFYWHIGSAQPSRLRLESYLGGVESAVHTALEHALDTVEAVQAGQFPPRPPTEGCPGNCPPAAFCWRYAPRAW